MSMRKALWLPWILPVGFIAVLAIAFVGLPRPRRKPPDNLTGEDLGRKIRWEAKNESRS